MSIQTDIDKLVNGVSVFNLALNVAGIINNEKNVALYVKEENTSVSKNTYVGKNVAVKQPKMINILEGSLGRLSGVSNVASKVDGNGIVMSAEIIENCRLTEHPLEDGKVITDNKVILPTEINVTITLPAQDYKDKLNMLKKYKNDRQMIYIETKFGVYPNMQIVNIPCNMNINNINRLTFTVKFKEVLIAGEESAIPENASDSDMINTGTQTGVKQVLKSVVLG